MKESTGIQMRKQIFLSEPLQKSTVISFSTSKQIHQFFYVKLQFSTNMKFNFTIQFHNPNVEEYLIEVSYASLSTAFTVWRDNRGSSIYCKFAQNTSVSELNWKIESISGIANSIQGHRIVCKINLGFLNQSE